MARENIRAALNKADESLLYEGANLSQLSILFKCDHRVLKEKMHGVPSVGLRGGVPIYNVSEVASRMGKLTEEQVDKAIRRMNHADLPKALTKEFWAGLKSKQDYELRAGALWPTDRVVAEVGEMVKSIKMELDLTIDAIERQSEMTEKQRQLAQNIINGAKSNMLKRLQERFVDQVPDLEPEPVVEPEPEEDPDEL